MTIYVGSLKFSPIFKSHCCAFGKAAEEKGYSVKYLFSREYEWMLEKDVKKKTIFLGNSVNISSMMKDSLSFKNKAKIGRAFSEDSPSHVYLHNYHFLNHHIAKLTRRNGGTFIYHVHEPYVQNKSHHGGVHQYWLHIFEYFQRKLLGTTDVAIVSSDEASRLFDLKHPNFSGKKLVIPLMYEDLGNPNSTSREFITFVGPPVPAKNPEKFLEIVKCSNQHGLDFRFLLISRSKTSDPRYLREENLQVFSKKRISDQEFGDLIKRSIAVLTPYKRETQSSVVLVSYMYGTPVASTNVGGLQEFVFHKKTGYLLEPDSKVGEWIEAICYVRDNFPTLSKNCRSYFSEKFSEKNWGQHLDKLNLSTHHVNGQEVSNHGKILGLELGCGNNKQQGLIGLDIRKTPSVDVLADARALPFLDESFNYVFTSHLIEHFSHREINQVLAEWSRVLKRDGTMEIRCPDLRARAFLFVLNPSYQNVKNIYGGQNYQGDFHRCGFSYGLLKHQLESCGIRSVRRVVKGYKGIPFIPECLHVKGVKSR